MPPRVSSRKQIINPAYVTDFHHDRDVKGHPGEYLILSLLHSRGIPAFLNPAPDPDDFLEGSPEREQAYLDRAAYDIGIGYEESPVELWDVKTDWLSFSTGNICAEKASLEHTKASKFVYLLPSPSGFYIHSFETATLIELYNAQRKVPNQDGHYFAKYVYPHKIVGNQNDNLSVLLPRAITDSIGRSFWRECKTFKEVTFQKQ